MYKRKGFTLLELIVAIAVLAIVMTMGYKIWTGINKDYKTQSDITKSQGDARNAVSEIVNKLKRADAVSSVDPIKVEGGNKLTITTTNSSNPDTFVYQEVTDPDAPSMYVLAQLNTSNVIVKVLVRKLKASDGFTATYDGTKVSFTIKVDGSNQDFVGDYSRRSNITN